jgi:tRNA threonylcarbamoyladenosine biosynthesis protein TsaE
MKWIVKHIEDLSKVAPAFLKAITDKKVIAFNGEMGVGKTTFVAELVKCLGVEEWEGSPTYSLVNEYRNDKGERIFHFDLYRLKKEDEAYDMGLEELIYGPYFCFIEWAEKIKNLLPNDVIWVNICKLEDDSREISLEL